MLGWCYCWIVEKRHGKTWLGGKNSFFNFPCVFLFFNGERNDNLGQDAMPGIPLMIPGTNACQEQPICYRFELGYPLVRNINQVEHSITLHSYLNLPLCGFFC